jgi:hypothetical protein
VTLARVRAVMNIRVGKRPSVLAWTVILVLAIW